MIQWCLDLFNLITAKARWIKRRLKNTFISFFSGGTSHISVLLKRFSTKVRFKKFIWNVNILIQSLCKVCSTNNDDTFVWFKSVKKQKHQNIDRFKSSELLSTVRWKWNRPVHLSQQLVDGLSGVGVHRRLDSLPAHAVQLIDEDDTGSVRFCLFCKTQKGKLWYNCVINGLLTFPLHIQ